MNKEEFILILEALGNMDETREIKKLKDKVSIFVERHNLDENYQKEMQLLADRMNKINEVETEEN